ERPDDRVDPRELQSVRRQVHLLNLNRSRARHRRQQVLQLLQPLPVRILLVGGLQNQSEVILQSPLDRIVERQRQHIRRRLPAHQASVKALVGATLRRHRRPRLLQLLLYLLYLLEVRLRRISLVQRNPGRARLILRNRHSGRRKCKGRQQRRRAPRRAPPFFKHISHANPWQWSTRAVQPA